MKSVFLSDQSANEQQLTEQQRAWVTPRTENINGEERIAWCYAKGQVVEGDFAVLVVRFGMAAPLDDECAKACGLSADQLAHVQVEYEMTSKGLDDKDERALYRAGVITGFDKHHELIHGPNWDKYQAALKAKEETEV